MFGIFRVMIRFMRNMMITIGIVSLVVQEYRATSSKYLLVELADNATTTNPICTLGCHPEHGYCLDPNTCHCHSGNL